MAYTHARLRNTLAIVRIGTGLLFLDLGWYKVNSIEFARVDFIQFLADAVTGGAPAWYATFLRTVVFPQPTKWAVAIGFLELALGVGLVLGLAIRVMSLAGMVYTANMAIATWHQAAANEPLWHFPDEQLRYILPFFILLLLGIGHAGENWGLGALYHKHRHKRWEKGWEIKFVDGLPQYEQKRSPEQIRDEQERLKKALSAARGFAWEWSARTGQVEVSGSVPAIYDLDLSQPVRELLWKYVHPEDCERVRSEFENGFSSGRGCQVEYRMVHPSGAVYWLWTGANVTNDPNGEPTGLVGFTRDITDRKAAEEVRQSSEKVAIVCRFAGTITHEITQPLEKAIGLVDALHGDLRDPETARKQVELAEGELKRISEIASNALSFYRESFTPSRVNLSEALDGILESYSSNIRYENIRIRKRYEYKGEIESSPGEIRELFSSLIQNALDAVAKGGTVTLHTKLRRDPKDPLRSGVLVSIADDGHGITREDQGRLFTPFFTTKGEERSGLGLWVARGLAQKHGGSIRWRSSTRPQRSGTCFSVFLPIRVVQVTEQTVDAAPRPE